MRGGVAVRQCETAAFEEPRLMWASALASAQTTDSCRGKPVCLTMGKTTKEAEGGGGEGRIFNFDPASLKLIYRLDQLN